MIEPMTAHPAAALPDARRADRFAFEAKADGWRGITIKDRGRVRLISRQQRPLTHAFPEVVAGLLEQVPDGTVLDGELVVHHGGRFDFGALQRRTHPAGVAAARRGELPAAAYMVFDLLFLSGVDLRPQPYLVRRERLEQLLGAARPPLVCMPMTRDLAGAHAWLHDHAAAGVEGVVVKHVRHGYLPATRSWSKIRSKRTAEALVLGVSGSLDRPETLLLALPRPDGGVRFAGRTSVLPAPVRRELGALLTATDSPPVTVRSAWRSVAGRVSYLPVEPTVVVELSVDAASFDDGVWRHPARFVRWRPDLTVEDLTPPVA